MKSDGLYGQLACLGVYCLTGQLWLVKVAIVVRDRDDEFANVAARISPEIPTSGSGLRNGLVVICIYVIRSRNVLEVMLNTRTYGFEE